MKWRDIDVRVEFNPEHYKDDHLHFCHIQVFADERLPITETGYRSNFMAYSELDGYENAEAFVLAWLDHEAQKSEWTKYEQVSKQMVLF
jgi:hypothetical protein